MKRFGLASFILSFPLAVWIFMSNAWDSDPRTSMVSEALSFSANSPSSPETKASSHASNMDLRDASAMTIKKINEIDEKIAAALVELRKNQANRNAVVQDLLKIQAKIDSIVKADSNL